MKSFTQNLAIIKYRNNDNYLIVFFLAIVFWFDKDSLWLDCFSVSCWLFLKVTWQTSGVELQNRMQGNISTEYSKIVNATCREFTNLLQWSQVMMDFHCESLQRRDCFPTYSKQSFGHLLVKETERKVRGVSKKSDFMSERHFGVCKQLQSPVLDGNVKSNCCKIKETTGG